MNLCKFGFSPLTEKVIPYFWLPKENPEYKCKYQGIHAFFYWILYLLGWTWFFSLIPPLYITCRGNEPIIFQSDYPFQASIVRFSQQVAFQIQPCNIYEWRQQPSSGDFILSPIYLQYIPWWSCTLCYFSSVLSHSAKLTPK